MTVCKNKVVYYLNDLSLGRAFFDMRFRKEQFYVYVQLKSFDDIV